MSRSAAGFAARVIPTCARYLVAVGKCQQQLFQDGRVQRYDMSELCIVTLGLIKCSFALFVGAHIAFDTYGESCEKGPGLTILAHRRSFFGGVVK